MLNIYIQSQANEFDIILKNIQVSMSTVLNQLIDMGCNPIISEAAIKNLKTEDLSALIDWISDHSEEEEKWSKWLQENNQGSQGETKVEGGQSISHLVKKQIVDELIKKGNSKNVSEKAVLMSGNTSLPNAEKWIDDHRYDHDFEEPLLLQGTAFQESTMTDEEARQKLKQLTDKAREIRKKRQEQQARQQQKNRLRYGKQMVEAKRIAEEQAMKRQLELDKIQKRKDEEYKQQLVEQMRREREEKLGKKGGQGTQATSSTGTKVEEKKLSKIEQVEVQCQQVVVGMHAYPEKAKIFFETANIYVSNIVKNNGDEKTRKINKANKAFQERIAGCFAGVETLEVIGFHEEDGFLVMKNYDLGELGKIAQILQRHAAQY